MICRVTFAVVGAILITGLTHAQGIEFKVIEEDKNLKERPVVRDDWVSTDSFLDIDIPENWVVEYCVVSKDGTVKQTGQCTGPDERLYVPDYATEGEVINIKAYEIKPGGEREKQDQRKIQIIKKGIQFGLSGITVTPAYLYEFGKKENPTGGETTDVAPSLGLAYLFSYKNPKCKRLSHVLSGPIVSMAKTRVLKEGEKAMGASGVESLGWAMGLKLDFLGSPLVVLGLGGIANLTGEDVYYYAGLGVGTSLVAE